MNKERIQELENLLKKAREAYYNLEPAMSDSEYDARKAELMYLNPVSKEIVAVGAKAMKNSAWQKAEHTIPMGSLEKVNSKDEFFKWCEGTGAYEFLLTHKIDGSSMELIYKSGKLIQAITRGDGLVGEDVTSNVMQIPTIPHTIPYDNNDVTVRGEVVMFKDVFKEKYEKEYANPRNTANGKVRERKNGGVDCKNLNFLAYTVYFGGELPNTEERQFELLKEAGFEVPFHIKGSMFDLANVFESIKDLRDQIHYEIDGLVIRVEDISIQDSLGSKNMKPNGQIAWKFEAAMSTSKVVGIRWQVGPSGRVTPVASIEPVSIGGVTITSVSLHNIALFKKMKLYEGCEVLVARRQDVIPYIETNISLGINASE